MPTLQSIGIHPQLREKLLALEPAVETPQAFLSRDPASLAKALNAPLHQIFKVRAAVADALAAKSPHGKRALQVAATVGNTQEPFIVGAVSALDKCRYHEFLHGNRETAGISTQVCRLDELLSFPPEFKCFNSGGVPFGYVTQVSGPPASGKTQLALRLAAQHAARGNKVIFLASGYGHGTLLPLVRRLKDFCEKENFQNILQNVTFVVVQNGHEALSAMDQLVGETNRSLLILDSASGCLSADLYAAGDTGKAMAQQVAYCLRRIARHSGAAVLVTNGTVSASDNGVKAAMGQAWNVADISLWFQPRAGPDDGSNKCIRVTLEHHLAKPTTPAHRALQDYSVEIAITSTGIVDAAEEQQPRNEQ